MTVKTLIMALALAASATTAALAQGSHHNRPLYDYTGAAGTNPAQDAVNRTGYASGQPGPVEPRGAAVARWPPSPRACGERGSLVSILQTQSNGNPRRLLSPQLTLRD